MAALKNTLVNAHMTEDQSSRSNNTLQAVPQPEALLAMLTRSQKVHMQRYLFGFRGVFVTFILCSTHVS